MSFVQPNHILDSGSKMNLGPDDWSSISIPVIPDFLSLAGTSFGGANDVVTLRLMLMNLFYHHLGVGKVQRVDLVTTPANPTIGLNYPRLSAYVHFDYWADNDAARALRAGIMSPEPFRLYGITSGPVFHPFTRGHNKVQAFLALNVNKQPIQLYTGPLNIHQLWAKVCYFEKLQETAAAAASEVA